MVDVGQLLNGFGPLLMAGDVAALARRYHLPCVIEMHGQQSTKETRAELEEMLRNYSVHVREQGVVQIRSTIQSQGLLTSQSSFATARLDYLDKAGEVLNRSLTHYVLRRTGTDWRIAVVSIGRSAGGICHAFLGGSAA
ncbi:MAG: hypothetical protein AAF666_16825 [Pseudomonadota bacterium]